MTYFDTQHQNAQFNPQQWAPFGSQAAQPFAWLGAPSMQANGGYGPGGYGLGGYGLGQAAYGQQYGQYGGQPSIGAFGHIAGWGGQQQQPQWGAQQQQPQWGQQWGQPQWGGPQQRQLSPQDVNEVVRQLVPALPQILAQAQSPQTAIGYAAYGQAPYGQAPRTLSQQDVNEVVRQILPIVPQIVGMLQGQPQLQYAALHGGAGLGQFGMGNSAQNFGAQFASPQFQSAFGAPMGWGHHQRQLTQQDVADVTRQLAGLIPQVIGNLQAFGQQRMI